MKLPRSLSGARLAKTLRREGYKVTRQTGSHIRLTHEKPPVRHVTIPDHDSLRVGTLSSILSDVAKHLDVSKEELVKRLF
ncbi:MAG: type II toxin-antitoxin system HicA family toxin [Candidatus Nitrospinota bacterium M3_3B_026]